MRLTIALVLLWSRTGWPDNKVARDVELLHAVPSVIAVSSIVNSSPPMQPERIADGNRATSWASRSDELGGGWIAFRVPKDVRVTSIRMTVGDTRMVNDTDQFTLDSRIQKVRVTHGGKFLIEQRLDPASRKLQSIPVNAMGGDFKIELTELQLGTKPAWRHVIVSELEVWGSVPAGTSIGKLEPKVQVGSLDKASVSSPSTTLPTDGRVATVELPEPPNARLEVSSSNPEMDNDDRDACEVTGDLALRVLSGSKLLVEWVAPMKCETLCSNEASSPPPTQTCGADSVQTSFVESVELGARTWVILKQRNLSTRTRGKSRDRATFSLHGYACDRFQQLLVLPARYRVKAVSVGADGWKRIRVNKSTYQWSDDDCTYHPAGR